MKYFFAILLFASLASCAFSEELKPLERAVIAHSERITEVSYCSDGSDRSLNGKPRFYGPMEARGFVYKNYHYVAYYHADGRLMVQRRSIANEIGPWETTWVPGYKMTAQNRHNKIAFGVSEGDGRLHLSYDHHNTPVLNYAWTERGVADDPENSAWDESTFRVAPNLDLDIDPDMVTYPSFYHLKDKGNLLLYWRSGGATRGEMNLAHYDSALGKWNFIGRISSSEGHYKGVAGTRGPYNAGFRSDLDGNLHVAWLWREHAKTTAQTETEYYRLGNHGLFYARSSDGGFSWVNAAGKRIADTRTGERISIDSIGEMPIEVPMKLDPVNYNFCSLVDPKTGDFWVTLQHSKTVKSERLTHLYVRSAEDGTWEKRKETLNAGAPRYRFVGDILYAFVGETAQYSTRAGNFEDWTPMGLDIDIPESQVYWDLSDLSRGYVNLLAHHKPKNLGEPTPIDLFVIKVAE